MILLDTCALIWWTCEPEKLSPKAKKKCESSYDTGMLISSISFWEIGIKIKKKKLNIGLSLEQYIKRVKSMGIVSIIPVDEYIWLESLKLKWNHNDPADVVIVSTAILNKASIITNDAIICSFYKRTIW